MVGEEEFDAAGLPDPDPVCTQNHQHLIQDVKKPHYC